MNLRIFSKNFIIMKWWSALCVLAIFGTVQCADFHILKNHFTPAYPKERVIKGHEAVPHSAPYIVSISLNVNSSHICGGTLIGKEWILTAGHCITRDPIGMGVIAGLHKRNVLDEATQQRTVDFGKVHELFNGGVGPYDIALLHVSKPFDYTAYVQPAILPALNEIPTGNATLYGWGQTKPLLLTAAKTLQIVDTSIVELSECKQRLPDNARLTDTNICSDSYDAGISACNGDSGGPLVQEIEGATSQLIGIVSWGFVPCGALNFPSVYTRVSAYIDWTAKIMNAYYVLY